MGIFEHMEDASGWPDRDGYVRSETLVGVVESYGSKENIATVNVRFSVMKERQDIVENIELLSPYAGAKEGMYFVPEIGDRVVVLFPDRRKKNGYILGSLWDKESESVKKYWDKKNEVKEVSTAGGVKITIQDKDNKQALTAVTPKKMEFTMDDEKQEIRIQDEKKKNLVSINTKDQTIEIKAASGITLEVGKSKIIMKKDGAISIEGGTVTINGQECKINGKTKAGISAQEITVEGKMSSKISGKTKLDLQSSGTVKLNGGIIKLN